MKLNKLHPKKKPAIPPMYTVKCGKCLFIYSRRQIIEIINSLWNSLTQQIGYAEYEITFQLHLWIITDAPLQIWTEKPDTWALFKRRQISRNSMQRNIFNGCHPHILWRKNLNHHSWQNNCKSANIFSAKSAHLMKSKWKSENWQNKFFRRIISRSSFTFDCNQTANPVEIAHLVSVTIFGCNEPIICRLSNS